MMKPIPDHYRNLVRLPGLRQGKPRGSGNAMGLPTGSPAVQLAQPLFPNKVKVAGSDGRDVLKSGHNNSKIGRKVVKGPWSGMPIFTLALAERTTCPRTCVEWRTCYGNHMPWADRYLPGEELVDKLTDELQRLALKYRNFVVRLHVLGDFYDVDYALFWDSAMCDLRGLHIFGYTAHQPGSEIGNRLLGMRAYHGKRFSLRFSNGDPKHAPISRTDYRSLPLVKQSLIKGVDVLCPAQQGATLCCGTCALCWDAPSKTIVFERH